MSVRNSIAGKFAVLYKLHFGLTDHVGRTATGDFIFKGLNDYFFTFYFYMNLNKISAIVFLLKEKKSRGLNIEGFSLTSFNY